MNIRKAKKGELDSIIFAANSCFIPHRNPSYTFVNSVPHIYNNYLHDYSDIHFLVEDNHQIIALGANLINTIRLNNKNYKISRVGTIGTLTDFRGKGYMRQIMKKIDEENVNNNVIFSVLSGEDSLYNKYGYHKIFSCADFYVKTEKLSQLKDEFRISIREYIPRDLDLLYSIYKNNNALILRNKNEFLVHLDNNVYKLYTFLLDNKIVGYCSLKDNEISEICLDNYCYLKSCINTIIKNFNTEEIKIYVNKLDYKLFNELCDLNIYTESYLKLSIKVYDFIKTLKVIYLLNKKNSQRSIREVYQIKEEIYEFISTSTLKIKKTKKEPQKIFRDELEFMSYAFTNNFEGVNSQIFPFVFDIGHADKF